MGRTPVGDTPVERARLTARRLFGLDRSGPPPPQTLRGHPWNPWTLPNAIGFARIALIPVFLWLGLRTDDGTSAAAAVVYAVIAWGDYADGITARLTGQYSRLGALMDPLIDRVMVLAGYVVVWNFELLPRWAIALLLVRELFMLAMTRPWLRRGLELRINMWGRVAVWPIMGAVFWALLDVEVLAYIGIFWGLSFAWIATALYARDGIRQLRAQKGST